MSVYDRTMEGLAEEIRSICNSLAMPQAFFVRFIVVSSKTVEAWEAGRNRPDGSARRVLAMVKSYSELPQWYRIVR